LIFFASLSNFKLNFTENGISSYDVEYVAEDYEIS
jgi:hypothetical protein